LNYINGLKWNGTDNKYQLITNKLNTSLSFKELDPLLLQLNASEL